MNLAHPTLKAGASKAGKPRCGIQTEIETTSNRISGFGLLSDFGFRDSAFTLTDLLVTVAVLSLLVAIAVTAGMAVKRSSRLARCLSNLQTVNRAVITFCNDHSQTLPDLTPDLPGNLWWYYKEQVKRYAGLTGPSSAKDT